MMANAIKTVVITAVLGLSVIAAPAVPAAANTYRTSCTGDDCARFKCDDWGRDCIRLGYFEQRTSAAITSDRYRDAYRENPDSFFGLPPDPDNDYDSDGGLYYHYRNHSDPDNDYNEYPD